MSLRIAVAAPFVEAGTDRLSRSDFVVELSLDRDWFSPEQSKRLIDVAASEGLLAVSEDVLELQFDPASVTVPPDFVPREELLRERSIFERVLDALVAAGVDKQDAVASINGLQSELAITLEAAAVIYARRQGIEVGDAAERAIEDF